MAERKWPRAIQKLQAGLADEAQAARLVGLAFDFAVAQPVSTYVAPDRVLADLDRALDARVTEAWAQAHVKDWIEREKARAEERGDTVGDWLSPEMQAELRSIAARPVDLDERFLNQLVKQDAVQHMLRSIVEETLERFVSTFKAGGSGGGLAGAVGRKAFGIAGRALGNLGEQIERQLRAAVSTFVQGSMSVMLDRLVVILSSPETQQRLGRMKLTGYEEALKRPTARVMKGVERLPLDDLIEALPAQLVYNLQRAAVRQAIAEDVAHWLEVEGERPVRDLLADDEAVAELRAEVLKVGAPLVQAFGLTEAYLGWLHDNST